MDTVSYYQVLMVTAVSYYQVPMDCSLWPCRARTAQLPLLHRYSERKEKEEKGRLLSQAEKEAESLKAAKQAKTSAE